MRSHPLAIAVHLCGIGERVRQETGTGLCIVEVWDLEEKNLSDSMDTRMIFFAIFHLSERVIARLEAMPDVETEEAARLTDTFLTLTELLKHLAPYAACPNPPEPPDASRS